MQQGREMHSVREQFGLISDRRQRVHRASISGNVASVADRVGDCQVRVAQALGDCRAQVSRPFGGADVDNEAGEGPVTPPDADQLRRSAPASSTSETPCATTNGRQPCPHREVPAHASAIVPPTKTTYSKPHPTTGPIVRSPAPAAVISLDASRQQATASHVEPSQMPTLVMASLTCGASAIARRFFGQTGQP